jgi:protoporphyrinogen oxidase
MEMKRIAVIGAGISGLTVARLLHNKHHITIYEAADTVGGLVRCERIDGSLFHICGGHVFNTKHQKVFDWFWQHFDKEKEFHLAQRNSSIFMPDGQEIPYPIENYIYLLPGDLQEFVIRDLIELSRTNQNQYDNFEEFLQRRFGNTLYNLYFKPYNEKIWRRTLNTVPIDWLEGKLPMPRVEEIIYNNFNHIAEKQFVHSSFYYEHNGGSQFLVNRLVEGLDIRLSSPIEHLNYDGGKWIVNNESYDSVVFCGNVRQLSSILNGVDIQPWEKPISDLQYHGTTTVFCEIDANPYSWIYLPSDKYQAHRIICTGNFAPSNNAPGHMTGSIEFTDEISEDEIKHQLSLMPLHPRYITHRFHEYTYPIQDQDTRSMLQSFKKEMASHQLFMTGRFVDWEYYNMDIAMLAAMQTSQAIL